MRRVFSIVIALLLLLTSCQNPNNQAIQYTPEPINTASSSPTEGDIGEVSNIISDDINDILEITFIDVGQADAALIICGDEVMMIDGGNAADSDLIYTFLKDKEINHLDYVIATHSDEDHCGGLSGALHVATASQVYAPVNSYDSKAFNNLIKSVEGLGLSLTIPEAGSSFTLGSAEVQILGPLHDYSESNNTSIVIKIIFGETSFLFTGDMEREAELDLIDAGVDLSADVLKVGHHGSNTSSSYVFINEVMPSYGIISCEKNSRYGHPHEEVLSRFRDSDTLLYRTDLQGDIVCTSDGHNITFATEKNEDVITNPTEVAEGIYIGNKNSRKLHLPTCHTLPAEKNQIIFYNLSEAYDEGYSNCGNCMH